MILLRNFLTYSRWDSYICVLFYILPSYPTPHPHPIHTHKHMQVPLKETLQKRLEYEFHSASYHTILEVVIALKNAAGHLVKVLPAVLVPHMISFSFGKFLHEVGLLPFSPHKALVEHSSLSLQQQTVPQFTLTLYDHLKRNEDVLKEIGVHSTSPSQLACLVELPLTSLFYCLQLFASWIRDGVYDFATLPFGVKTNLSSQDQQLIQQVAHKWTGRERKRKRGVWTGYKK